MRTPIARCTDDELRSMLATGRVGRRPCNTLEAIYALALRDFVHKFTFTWQDRQYYGVAFFPHDQTNAAWQRLLVRAYSKKPIAKLWYEKACNDRNRIVKMPKVLREYLKHGWMPQGQEQPDRKLATPRDYLETGLRKLIHGGAYCHPPGRRRYRVFNLIEASGDGRSQTREALLKMLVIAFGDSKVMAAMAGLPAYEEFYRRWTQTSPAATA